MDSLRIMGMQHEVCGHHIHSFLDGPNHYFASHLSHLFSCFLCFRFPGRIDIWQIRVTIRRGVLDFHSLGIKYL